MTKFATIYRVESIYSTPNDEDYGPSGSVVGHYSTREEAEHVVANAPTLIMILDTNYKDDDGNSEFECPVKYLITEIHLGETLWGYRPESERNAEQHAHVMDYADHQWKLMMAKYDGCPNDYRPNS
jgi:hypothetical protein